MRRGLFAFKKGPLAPCERGPDVTRTPPNQIPHPHRIVLASELREFAGSGETQLKEMVAAGVFPKPIRLGPRKLGWILAEVVAWQEQKIAERDGRALSK
jgi:prophage regulatory protein